MMIPVAVTLGVVALLALSKSGKKASVTKLADPDEFETFSAGMGAPPLEASALVAVLPAEEKDFDVHGLARQLGELGYTELGYVVVDREGFDPDRARLRKQEGDAVYDEMFESDSLADFQAEIDARVEAKREKDRASAGHPHHNDPLHGVPHHKRAAVRQEMRRVMRRGVTKNPHVAARIAVRKVD